MKVRYKLRDAGVTEQQLKLLRPYLVGDRPRDDGEWDMYCPLHEDVNHRSAQLNIDMGVWNCFAGCGGGSVASLIRKQSDWVEPSAASSNGSAKTGRYEKYQEEVTTAHVAGWHAALMANEALMDELITSRGLWTPTLVDFQIGWDEGRRCYTIPVYDASGKLLNVRRYSPRPPKGQRKMKGVPGMNHAHLFPIRSLKAERIVIGEGEWDMLVTNQYGFPAITRTAGAQTWKREWNQLFRGKTVFVCHDMDTTGQEANSKVARALAPVAAAVYVIRLPYPLAEKGGKDLGDYWLEHDGDPDEFRRLLEDAEPFDVDEPEPEDVGPEEAEVLDSFDARRVGRPLRLTTTVKGRKDPGYSVPRKIHYSCTQDAGQKCDGCPLFETDDGEDDRIIRGADPFVLDMIDTPRTQIVNALVRQAGVPEGKCPRLRVTVEEHQSVEVLYARPSVEHLSGEGAGDYKTIKLTSVGRHDTLPNSTVKVVGALYPNPKTQLNEFLAWDVARMETSLDRFELDAETVETLKMFQPKHRQRPLKKVREIADDLAASVTRIYGRPEMHAVMDLAFHSALSFDFAGKRIHRGWLDVLIVGDTRTGKSEAAARLARHYRAGEIVSCEAASFAGIVGGAQQFANKEWTITWGAIPLNDRRLVVLDEAGGLDTEQIGAMSSVRSSGVAEIQKINQERTYARTRLIWIANPRDARMQDYTYGVQAIRPLIGGNEDIARYDLAMSVAAGEVASSEINRLHDAGEASYPSEACSLLLRWVWSRTPENVTWARGAERAVFKAASKLGGRYVEDPPLIQVANVREKVARIAVALAARTFSTDDTFERIIVSREHVRDAVSFIDRIYNMTGFGYAERSRELIGDQREAERNAHKIKVFMFNKPWLAKYLRSAGKFRRQDLEEIGNIDREEANAIISTLHGARMVTKEKGDVKLTPTLHNILRETNK